MPKHPRFIIIIEGGVIQDIVSDTDCEVRIFDWDNINAGDSEYLMNISALELKEFKSTLSANIKEIKTIHKRLEKEAQK